MSLETANHWEIFEKNPQVEEKLLPEVEKKLKWEVKKDSQEKLSQLNDEKLQTITNKDFLKYSQEARLQSLAKSPDGQKVTIEWIKSQEITDISFRFAFWENNKINENLQFKTTAGQILPNEVSSVISDWVEYSRAALDGEFFSQDNTRLEIFDETNIIISQVRDEQEMEILEKQNQEKLAEFMKEQDDENLSPELKKAKEKFAKEWLSRGFGSDFIMKIFAAIFLGIGKIEKAIWAGEGENIFTQIDKAIWNENKDGANIDRNNMSDEEQNSVIDSANKSLWNFEMLEWHDRFLSFISFAEWTHDNYNAIYGNGEQSQIKLTEMSLAAVLQYQKNTVLPQNWHSPVGKYQFNIETLQDYIVRHNLSLDQKFDADFQDKIAMIKLQENGLFEFQAGKKSLADFAKSVAGTWAWLPKDESELSYHHWVAGNKASVWFAKFSSELSKLKNM